MLRLVSPLERILTENTSVSSLELTLTRSLNLKSHVFIFLQKRPGYPFLPRFRLSTHQFRESSCKKSTFRERLTVTYKPKADDRCQHTTVNGRRCRMPRMNRDTPLCVSHRRSQKQLLNTQTLGAELLGSFDDFKTANAVNDALGKLFGLMARNQISPRNAAILAYIGQLLLNSLPVVKAEIIRDQGSAGWEKLLRRALSNELRASATSQPARIVGPASAPDSARNSNPGYIIRSPQQLAAESAAVGED